jgi:hypothetical protein
MKRMLAEGPLKQIYVDRDAAYRGEPCLTVLYGITKFRGREIYCDGPCKLVHPDVPLTPKGPAIWIETTAEVVIDE